MEIAVASGKGGTGKTTVSLSLARYYSKKGFDVALLDCDVEEPNANLFLGAELAGMEKCEVLIPSVDETKCTGCGKCDELCEYSAIVLIKGKPLVIPEMGHSCGGCALICPEKAIKETGGRSALLRRVNQAAYVLPEGGSISVSRCHRL
jgi:MinD superfamily P-loop ATPase